MHVLITAIGGRTAMSQRREPAQTDAVCFVALLPTACSTAAPAVRPTGNASMPASCGSRDALEATADEIISSCMDTAQPDRIVLLHVGAQSAAYEALSRMIAALREQGFACVTADQILRP